MNILSISICVHTVMPDVTLYLTSREGLNPGQMMIKLVY